METRDIKIGYPSGAVRMKFADGNYHVVFGLKSDKPYIKAWGRKYYLTADEIQNAKMLLSLI